MAPSGPTIHVFTMADANYAMPLAVTIRSLLENYRSQRPLAITVVDGGISTQDRARLEQSWRDACAGTVSWRFVPPCFGGVDSLPVWGRMPALTYARLRLSDYFAAPDARTVLLDSDTLVLADIAGLFETDLEGRTVAACVDPFIPTVSNPDGLANWKQLNLSPEAPYFNAGIMVVDLKRWHSREVAHRARDYIRANYRHLRQYDQDALNAALIDDWRALDARWHVHPRTANAFGVRLPDDPWIVHFSGRLKPWAYAGTSMVDALFFEYLGRTAWRSTRPRTSLQAIGYRLYDSPLRRLCYPLEVRAAAVVRRLQQMR